MEKIYLKDYKAPDYFIDQVTLEFDLYEDKTIVTNTSHVYRNPNVKDSPALKLNGEHLKFISLEIDGETVSPKITDTELIYDNPTADFTIKVVTEIDPANNKAFEGLYKSRALFCTQCEAEGFRRITYFVDRPDNMARFKTTIRADKSKYPILLSNGNLIEQKDLPDNRHQCTWEDPSKKPSYLFALVGGDLELLQDSFTTMSGRKIDLRIYVEQGRKSRCHHAMESLKRSMKWDEEKYGREYDLDIFMIVAVDDFNMGAMENKGLNIFNSKYILADSKTANDDDYENIEAVVGHEYFHNWTGNRITCRDWFQLSLKEGLTVYRDQEFTADMTSAPVKRIDDVNRLRAHQFLEDSGPNAHPVRPTYCYSVDNFYTSTIYEKGAEVIRMMAKLVGPEGFRKGMDLYFEMYDEQAVTTDDFVYAISKANNIDLTQFKRWYTQSGTPEISLNEKYDDSSKTYTLSLSQSCPPTPEQDSKENFHIPVQIGLIDQAGKAISFANGETDQLLELREKSQDFIFKDISEKPTLSLLRNFTAPVRTHFEQSAEELIHLMKYDSNDYNRWQSAQNMFQKYFVAFLNDKKELDKNFSDSISQALGESYRDPSFFARFLSLPMQSYLKQFLTDIDPLAVDRAHSELKKEIGIACEDDFIKTYEMASKNDPQSTAQKDVALRALQDTCLNYLVATEKPEHIQTAEELYFSTQNMSLSQMALFNLNSTDKRDKVLADFHKKWIDSPIVINNWLAAQASCKTPSALDRVKSSMNGPAFDFENPNKNYMLIGRFSGNPQFHNLQDNSYEFFTDHLLKIDKNNPQVAARFVGAYNKWKTLEPVRREKMKAELERIIKHEGLSKNTFELASNALKA